MNKFYQHIPTFIDGVDSASFEFNTLPELLNHEVIKRYSSQPQFEYFAMSGSYLMQICDDGFHWWVVGTIKNPDEVKALSIWDGGKYLVEIDGKQQILEGKNVYSSCGDEVVLKDGRKGKRVERK